MAWIKKTFDKVYLEAFSFLNKKASKEVSQIIKLLKIEKKHLILDTCCGWGRHVCPLFKKGYKIKGIDISNEFISHAKKVCPSKLFAVKDIRNINYKDKFDVVLNLETSFGYYNDEENLKILKKIYSSLKDEGKFMIDLINPHIIFDNFKENLILFDKDHVKIIDLNKLDKNKKIIRTNRYIYLNETKFEKEIILRIYSKKDLQEMLKKVGFKKIQYFGNFKGEKYNKNSFRFVALAQK